MWIEIHDREYSSRYLINTANIESIHQDDHDTEVIIAMSSGNITLYGAPFYEAMIMAIQGHDVDLEELGHVAPFKNGQREEIAKRLNYMDAISDTKN